MHEDVCVLVRVCACVRVSEYSLEDLPDDDADGGGEREDEQDCARDAGNAARAATPGPRAAAASPRRGARRRRRPHLQPGDTRSTRQVAL